MGQSQSAPPPPPRSHEELSRELAHRFAQKCFSSLEIYCLKDNFKSLADRDQDLRFLKEDTVARFLALPDILGASPVVFQMVSYLAAFPFLSDAPAVLGLEQLVIVVTLLTDRYRRVLAHGPADRHTLLFRSLAVHDRTLFAGDAEKPAVQASDGNNPLNVSSSRLGFAVDAPVDDADADTDANEDDTDSDNHLHDDDELARAALEALDYVHPSPEAAAVAATAAAAKAAPRGPGSSRSAAAAALHGARIPADNFRKLLLLLLLVAPLGPQEDLSRCADRFAGEALASLRAAAECILATFLNVETSPGIQYAHFDAIMPVCCPYLFQGFNALFEHFLFSKNVDLSRMKPGLAAAAAAAASTSSGDSNMRDRRSSSSTAAATPANGAPTSSATTAAASRRKASLKAMLPEPALPPPPLLPHESENTILDLHRLAQLSFFLPGASLFHRVRPLYVGDSDGFSLGAFETKVFHWRAPTLLLVQGTRLRDTPPRGASQEAAFAAALPPRRFPRGNGGRHANGVENIDPASNGATTNNDTDDDDDTLIFGAYVNQPWQLTHRTCFGDDRTVLFQLSPVHDVFGASTLNRDYVAFVKPSAANQHAGGIGFGCPPPASQSQWKRSSSSSLASTSGLASTPTAAAAGHGLLPLGPLSLLIDANLEFGVMTHDCGEPGSSSGGGGGGGGAFHPSVARAFRFQERFAIEALEVWGCGGDAEAQVQAERWAWEAREAEARRRINLGTGDKEADRALLEMAGIIGGNRSGGSMG
ncbi:tldc domain containing protein 2 [Niveomyces insectorum RCEF 264]|uniref:Restriction of telomere capping protein 5 n=1 Tax=Niveomyces insectorum RCEF 264 TaxID=1081102 RepID=A0A167TGY0_9HYPO|nr:tldc domain containing protein 2 [Niveomyces insectorum RCEF 264]